MSASLVSRDASRRGIVFHIAARLSVETLQASARRTRLRGAPAGLQVIVAAAMLTFEIGKDERCYFSGLRAAECDMSGEGTLVRLLDRELARLYAQSGTLVTYNGGQDLAVLRLAALRHRLFQWGGAASWITDSAGRHEDLMLALGQSDATRAARLADMSTALGLHSSGDILVGAPVTSLDLARCELDVVATAALYLNVIAERCGGDEPLRFGIPTLAKIVEGRLERSPHLTALLRGRLFQDYRAS